MSKMNWKKATILAGLYLTGSKITEYLRGICIAGIRKWINALDAERK